MSEQDKNSPLPPKEKSIYQHTMDLWTEILKDWERGWHAETKVANVENLLEQYRVQIFVDKTMDPNYDWATDWQNASRYNDFQRDWVLNRRARNDATKAMWLEWCQESSSGLRSLSIEALRGMILVDGAAILACLAVLSGEVTTPSLSAILASKIMLFFSVVSLILMATGHLIASIRLISLVGRVRGSLVGFQRHRRLYAIGRYLRRYLDRVINISNFLIYSSIITFAISALISSIILTFDLAK